MKKPIAIIGSMGPQASLRLYELLITKAVLFHGARLNDDFPYIVLQSLSVPDFIGDSNRKNEAYETIKMSVEATQTFNPVAVCIACNTAHIFQDQIVTNQNLPFISLIDTVVEAVCAQGLEKVGVLASTTTVTTKLYDRALNASGIICVTPSATDQKNVEEIIRAVISGESTPKHAEQLKDIASGLHMHGAQAIVLGCTELPIVMPRPQTDFALLDCLDLLADKLLGTYYQQ